MSCRVLLTGGNGYIGSHILAQLLERGYHVCCPVRSASKGDKILDDFAGSQQKSQIHICVVPDIVAPGAYDHVLQQHTALDTVIHTASPFSSSGTTGNNLEVLDPAVKGTTGLLRSIKAHAPGVRRVVYTSSAAAIVDYDRITSDPPRVLTEEDWSPITWDEAVHGNHQKAYRASKKFAELAARAFVEEESPNFDLVTLCPPATFGPPRHSVSSIADLNESNARLWKFCFDTNSSAAVPYIPVHTYVDVRDLALAHVQATLVPEAGNQRFFVFARQFSIQEICDILRAKFPDELETRTPVGSPGTSSLPPGAYNADNSKVKDVLGIKFRSLEETVVDGAKVLLDIEKKDKARSEAQMV